MNWLGALKEWNKGNAKYTIPKKGSKEYLEVRALMDGTSVKKPKKKKV
jgi:hypothetical protein